VGHSRLDAAQNGAALVTGPRFKMPDLEPLTCIVCVRRVDATSYEAEGWRLVERSVDRGDRSDDTVWMCGDCLAEDEFFDPPDAA